MRAILVVFAVFCVALVSAGDDLDLDQSNFQQTIDENDFVLAMFYAPWCGHCKNFKPHFAEAATKAKGKYVLAKIDCTLDTAKELCQDHEVRGYPTIKFFKRGVAQDYNGPRDTEGVLNWLEKKTGPVTTTLTSATLTDFLTANSNVPVVIGYFSAVDSDAHKAFLEAANDASLEEFKFGQVIGGEKKDNTIELVVKHSQTPILFEGESASLVKFLFENSFPLVDEVGGHNFQKYVQLGKPLHLVFVEPTYEKIDQLKKDLETIAAENKDEAFSWIDAVKYKQNVKGMGASGDVLPCIIRLVVAKQDAKPVVFEEELSLDNLRKWVAGVKSGVYKYVPKSEPIPEENDGPVKVVVGKTWESIVLDATKNVLVEFYAPWCGHCKSLAPKYEELGQKFVGSSDFVIAKIDGTANDVEANYEIKGFPTLLLYSKTAKSEPIVYEGPREVDDLEKFLLENK